MSEHLDDVQGLARGLSRAHEEVGESVGELREGLAELHLRRQEPTVDLSLTEKQLLFLDEAVGETPIQDPRPESHQVFEMIKQLIALEQGAGGKFCDPA